MRWYLVMVLLTVSWASACSDGRGTRPDAQDETICIPGRLRCDPEGTNMLQQCAEDGMSWRDFIQCDLCHDSQCYGRLDGSSD